MYLKSSLADFDLQPQESIVEPSLAARLKLLGITTIDNASVDAYQQRMIDREHHVGKQMLIRTLVVASVLLVGATAYVVFGPGAGLPDVSFAIPYMIGVGVIALALRLGRLMFMGTAAGSHWESTKLERYLRTRKVPRQILERARSIQTAMPDAELTVEHFKRDPFLTVWKNGQRARVGVWDEHRFA